MSDHVVKRIALEEVLNSYKISNTTPIRGVFSAQKEIDGEVLYGRCVLCSYAYSLGFISESYPKTKEEDEIATKSCIQWLVDGHGFTNDYLTGFLLGAEDMIPFGVVNLNAYKDGSAIKDAVNPIRYSTFMRK